ncbi:MAG: carboxypeptidase regulatory-like domain-containing protein [Gemmatimonadales bacterium]
MLRVAMLVLLAVIAPASIRAQAVVRAPDGTLTGLVRDSASGEPVGFALVIVVGRERRSFATEAGRFAVRVPDPGSYTLRVQQIGYAPAEIPVRVDRDGPASPGLEIRLARRVLVLPDLAAVGDRCGPPGSPEPAGSLVDLALINVERLLAAEQGYPTRTVFQRVTSWLDSAYTLLGGRVDTIQRDSRRAEPYRRGRVISRRGPWNRREVANYFSTADIARDEFRRWHCFWYSGPDSTGDRLLARVDFAPQADVTEPDWAGSLLLDARTGVLVSSESRLVNLPSRGSVFESAQCRVTYRELAATVLQEGGATCTVIERSRPRRIVIERWILVQHEFLGRRPDTP